MRNRTKHNKKGGRIGRHSLKKTIKKQNCSPAVKGKTVLDHTCFTKEALENLKIAYNTHHENKDPITTNDPKMIWETLSARLSHCDKETCWLNQISDPKMKEKMETQLFAPLQPKEWKKNHNEWLSNFDILKVIKQYEETYPEFTFIGPTPIDFDTRIEGSDKEENGKCVWEDLCHFSLSEQLQKGKKKFGIIFNLDDHTQNGSHWVSFFIDTTNDLGKPLLFYFDSTSAPIPPEIKKLVDRLLEQGKNLSINFDYNANTKTEHQKENTECGMYSLFFIVSLLTREVENKPMKPKQLLNMFKGSKRIPDKYVEKYRSIYFNE